MRQLDAVCFNQPPYVSRDKTLKNKQNCKREKINDIEAYLVNRHFCCYLVKDRVVVDKITYTGNSSSLIILTGSDHLLHLCVPRQKILMCNYRHCNRKSLYM